MTQTVAAYGSCGTDERDLAAQRLVLAELEASRAHAHHVLAGQGT